MILTSLFRKLELFLPFGKNTHGGIHYRPLPPLDDLRLLNIPGGKNPGGGSLVENPLVVP